MKKIELVVGEFALVSSGNGTCSWIIHDDRTQERANAAMDSYWNNGHDVKIHEIKSGAAIFVEGTKDKYYALDMYTTEEAARADCKRRGLELI